MSSASVVLLGDTVRSGGSRSTHDPAVRLSASQHPQRQTHPHLGVLPQPLRSVIPRGSAQFEQEHRHHQHERWVDHCII